MAAAYAEVVSLMNTIDLLQINHPRIFISSFDNKQIQSLNESVVLLQHFLEESRQQEEDLESLIAAAAHAAEDAIESHVTNQLLAKSTGKSSSSSLLDLQKVLQDMDSVKEKVMEVVKGKEMTAYNMHRPPTNPMPSMTSSRLSTTGKSTMVGSEDAFKRLMDMLTGHESTRQIIPVTGMGGIGKTTLVKNAYEDSYIVRYFYIRGWAVVSQQYSVRGILVQLLSCLKKQGKSAMDHLTNPELCLELHQSLFGKKYLIVLDDVWRDETWDEIKNHFPDEKNCSRIVVTTRDSSVANCFGSPPFVMNFLDEDQSWKLFCEKTFGQQNSCPREFENIGKQIIKKCKGLPLSIVAIGGLLGKSNRSQEYWKNVSHDLNSILLNSGDVESCTNILSLSYTNLPVHLKPCFLYLGVFRKDREICVSRLIKLCVAEGFLKPNKPQSLEEVAEGYFKDLVDRNLILVHRLGSSGKIRSYKIHDLLRDLCLRVVKKEKLLRFTRVIGDPQGIDTVGIYWERRFGFSKSTLEEDYDPAIFHSLHSGSLASYVVCAEDKTQLAKRYLKPIFQQVRHIEIGWPTRVNLSHISLCCNLQTLDIAGSYIQFVAPNEIWVIWQLRHLQIDTVFLPDPPPPNDHDQQDEVLLNLQTLRRVVNFNLSAEVCRRIPNIKKLVIEYCDEGSISNYCINNLGRLSKLESLRLDFFKLSFATILVHRLEFSGRPFSNYSFQNITFPISLKKLSLTGCNVYWDDLTIIGSLPHLEVLKLLNGAAMGSQWNPIKGQFLSLKFLKIYFCDLDTWNADNSHFPVLETLFLRGILALEEIPLDLVYIPKLQHIHLEWCSESAAISAMKILEERASFEDEGIQVRMKFVDQFTFDLFKEKVEPETLTRYNFQFQVIYPDKDPNREREQDWDSDREWDRDREQYLEKDRDWDQYQYRDWGPPMGFPTFITFICVVCVCKMLSLYLTK